MEVLSKPPTVQSWGRASTSGRARPNKILQVPPPSVPPVAQQQHQQQRIVQQPTFILFAPTALTTGIGAVKYNGNQHHNYTPTARPSINGRKMVAVSLENGNLPVSMSPFGSSAYPVNQRAHAPTTTAGRPTTFSTAEQRRREERNFSEQRNNLDSRRASSGQPTQNSFTFLDACPSKKPLAGPIKYSGPNVAQSFYYEEPGGFEHKELSNISNPSRLNSSPAGQQQMILRNSGKSPQTPSSSNSFQRSPKRRASYRAITPVNSHRQISPVSPPQKQTVFLPASSSDHAIVANCSPHASKSQPTPSSGDKQQPPVTNNIIVPRREEIVFASKQENCNTINNSSLSAGNNNNRKSQIAASKTTSFPASTQIGQQWEAYYDENGYHKTLARTDRPSHASDGLFLESGSKTLSNRGQSASRRATGSLRAAKSEVNLKETGSRNSSNNSNSASTQKNSMLSDGEIYQIQLMYSGRATELVVCGCLANLYLAKRPTNGHISAAGPKTEWELAATGVPVLLLDCGDSRARQTRKLQIVLAEKGTGFTLWRDVVDNLTRYTEVGKSFHTMLLSTDHKKLAGLSFDNPYASMQFYQQGIIRRLRQIFGRYL